MKKIQLQFAMDGAASRSIEDALGMIGDIAGCLDIIEAGTSFVLRYGMESVTRFKTAFPEKKILADMKIMDGGYHHTAMGCRAGGDIITVLGAAAPETIRSATQAAHDNGKEIMVDLLCVSDMERTISLCERTGADYVCVHCGVDMQSAGGNPYAQLLQAASMVKNCKIAVAGGISEDTIEDICRLGPDVVIVGGAIHKRTDYISAAGKIHRGIRRVCQEVSDHGTSHC